MEILEPELEKLLQSKSFEELKPDERIYVSKYLSKPDYINYHFLLSKAAEALASEGNHLVPLPFRHPKKSAFTSIFQMPVFYRSIASAGIAAALFFVLNKPNASFILPKPDQGAASVKTNEKIKQPVIVQKTISKAPTPVIVAGISRSNRMEVLSATAELLSDSSAIPTSTLLGLDVHAPFLCLDIDVNDQIPGFKEESSAKN